LGSLSNQIVINYLSDQYSWNWMEVGKRTSINITVEGV